MNSILYFLCLLILGFVSFRNEEEGSWYIQTLVEVFKNYSESRDVETMLKKVNGLVSARESNSDGEYNGRKQCPSITSMLRGPVYFLSNSRLLQ